MTYLSLSVVRESLALGQQVGYCVLVIKQKFCKHKKEGRYNTKKQQEKKNKEKTATQLCLKDALTRSRSNRLVNYFGAWHCQQGRD